MRSSIRLGLGSSTTALASFLFVAALASPALADEPTPNAAPPAGTALEPLPPPPPSSALPPSAPPPGAPPAEAAPAPDALPSWAGPPAAPATRAESPPDVPEREVDTRRAEGIRLGLDLGFARAFSGSEDWLNAGTPTLLPIGASISFRTSPSLLLGFHGYAALASRDDCISADSCRARAYAFGGHIETPLSRGHVVHPLASLRGRTTRSSTRAERPSTPRATCIAAPSTSSISASAATSSSTAGPRAGRRASVRSPASSAACSPTRAA